MLISINCTKSRNVTELGEKGISLAICAYADKSFFQYSTDFSPINISSVPSNATSFRECIVHYMVDRSLISHQVGGKGLTTLIFDYGKCDYDYLLTTVPSNSENNVFTGNSCNNVSRTCLW